MGQYCPEIVKISKSMGRTPSALAMKMVNFASLDPIQQRRNIKGLRHASAHDKNIWDEFHGDWESLALESQESFEKLAKATHEQKQSEIHLPDEDAPTETKKSMKVRLVQKFFRDTVLSSYNFSCAICCLQISEMLNASHIIPWSVDKVRRANPRNGLSLCAFHDRAFDRGLITVDEELRIVLSVKVKKNTTNQMHRVGFIDIEGNVINKPDRFMPAPDVLAYHRDNIFIG